MNKQIKRKPATYVISKWTVDAHHRIYLTNYNLNDGIANWSSDYDDADVFINPVIARMVINSLKIKDADILCRPTEIEEETKEMKNNVIIQSNFYFKGKHVVMYVKTVDITTGDVKYTRDKRMASRFTCVSSAEKFIANFKPYSPHIIYCHDDTPDTLRYSATDVSATTELMKQIYNTEREMAMILPGIRNVIFNDPATIVFWDDGTKTVVKCQEEETYDPEKGIAMAISKKALGNKYDYYNTIKHWLKKAPKVETSRFYCNGVEYSKTVKED